MDEFLRENWGMIVYIASLVVLFAVQLLMCFCLRVKYWFLRPIPTVLVALGTVSMLIYALTYEGFEGLDVLGPILLFAFGLIACGVLAGAWVIWGIVRIIMLIVKKVKQKNTPKPAPVEAVSEAAEEMVAEAVAAADEKEREAT